MCLLHFIILVKSHLILYIFFIIAANLTARIFFKISSKTLIKLRYCESIDVVFRRMRQDISRLGRKTLSTAKDLNQSQNHLDLYTECHLILIYGVRSQVYLFLISCGEGRNKT